MVSRKQKERAVNYICERLEESGLYLVQKKDYYYANIIEIPIFEKPDVKPDVRELSRKIKVVIPNFLDAMGSFNYIYEACREKNIYLAPILFKDGKTAFVRMVERNPSWRMDKSLKRYTAHEINQMLHLRGMEKAVMETFGNELTYYQPKTANLEESLRRFKLRRVRLDYSHIDYGDPAYGFVEDRDSIDYKLPEETEVITGAAKFVFADRQPDFYCRARITGVE